jgi:hypothetical protein
VMYPSSEVVIPAATLLTSLPPWSSRLRIETCDRMQVVQAFP